MYDAVLPAVEKPAVVHWLGDVFDHPELLAGDGTHHSDGLLGIFTSLAPIVSAALQVLEEGRVDERELVSVVEV